MRICRIYINFSTTRRFELKTQIIRSRFRSRDSWLELSPRQLSRDRNLELIAKHKQMTESVNKEAISPDRQLLKYGTEFCHAHKFY